jgi:tetratricopeptide (TPR) repeat protein
MVGVVFLVAAGATVFFLTKAPDDERLLRQGRQELATGQYAFAVKTLTRATALRPRDSKAFLALARAYVGVDQIDKAWNCISHAQQLGTGVVADPALASDLAGYYRQRGRYDKAIDLLRPLAQANIPGKKAELADIDALWGDEALRNGQVDMALSCWEEVKDLRDGSRYAEAESRLVTIYQKLADASAAKNEDSKALTYLDKLNYIAQNAKNYQMAAAIYEREDKLDLAIEQIRKALTLDAHNQVLARRLALLLTRRGKELMDGGNNEAGYAYLQQAKSLDGSSVLPEVTLRNLAVGVEPSSQLPRVKGEVWNPTDKIVNSVTIRAELWDNVNEKMLWGKDSKLIDEFVPPLTTKQSRPFEFVASNPVKANGHSEFRVYLNGSLYKSYPIGKVERLVPGSEVATGNSGKNIAHHPEGEPARTAVSPPQPAVPEVSKPEPLQAPTPGTQANDSISSPESSTALPLPAKAQPSAEERTMKDLDF